MRLTAATIAVGHAAPSPSPLPCGWAGAALDANRARLAGGFSFTDGSGAIDARTSIYDSRDSLFVPQPAQPAPRIAAAMLATGHGETILLGGEDAPRRRLATFWRWHEKPRGGR
ncbi:MAG: hypothetical protein RL077_5442 [Verrucomicrobiota bacterium]